MPLKRVSVIMSIVTCQLLSQTLAIVGSGYTEPTPITVAPGQIITIFVHGLSSMITARVEADKLPLPTSLRGISVFLRQTYSPRGPLPVPILSIFPSGDCVPINIESCSTLIGITLQIPFELGANPPGSLAAPNDAQLSVSDGSSRSAAVQLIPVLDQIHVLRYGSSTTPVVTHADGTPVSATNPGQSDEVLVMYAFGLGRTNPTVQTGEATPLTSPVTQAGFLIDYNYKVNALASRPRVSVSATRQLNDASTVPIFAGLTAGFVGLYQVNFAVPPVPEDVPSCSRSVGAGGAGIFSNLTVSIGGATSFDGAAICVDTSGRP